MVRILFAPYKLTAKTQMCDWLKGVVNAYGETFDQSQESDEQGELQYGLTDQG
jgi:hypothetical protein